MRERYGLRVATTADPAAEPAQEDLRVMLFMIVRELLLNVVKYAGVTTARVEMTNHLDEVHILVADEGRGFDPSAQPLRDCVTHGYGLFSIRERLQQVGGQMQIDSAPGQGTQIRVTVPLNPRPARNNGM